VPRHRRAVLGCAALAVALAGCTTRTNTTVAVSGKTLAVYASLPRGTAAGQDLLAAEQLALSQAGGRVGSFTVVLKPLYESSTKDITNNARRAIADSATIAYLGEVPPGSTENGSIEITNEAGILQVSPTDNALELTQTTPAIPKAPNTYYPNLKSDSYTFARVVPSTAVEAKAQVQQMQALGVKKLWIEDDGSPYGAALARAVHDSLPATITVAGTGQTSSATGADALFYATDALNAVGAREPAAAAAKLDSLMGAAPQLKRLFVPSALFDPEFAAKLGPAAARAINISVPGFLHSGFDSQFKAKYGHPPALQAVFGYVAMSALLEDLRQQGGNANRLSSVVNGFRSLSNQQSPIGAYSIKNGDIQFADGKAPFVWAGVKNGSLYPSKFRSVSG
jgi:branched-chain amino acid transport system substrate-binding protein